MTDTVSVGAPPASISIITVTYNSVNEISAFVQSLNQESIGWKLWLVDNHSSDGTQEEISRLSSGDDRVTIILNDNNVGLAAANNQPLLHLRTRYVAIVNPDVVLAHGALSTLVAYLSAHPDVVAAAPVNVDVAGTPHSSFHRNWTLAHLLVWRVLPKRISHWLYKRVRTYVEQDVLFASGACIVMRTEDMVRIGGYDESYFLTVEDVCDLCIRLREGDPSKRVVIVPDSRVHHLVSRSAAGAPYVTLWYGAYGSIYHFRKHHGLASGIVAFSIVVVSVIARIALSGLRSLTARRHVKSLRNHARVLVNLFRENPLRATSRDRRK